jgi:hypothetical protein
LPLLAHAVVYADGETSWVPAQQSVGPGAVYATEVKGRLKPRVPCCVRVIREGLATVADGDAAGREDRRAVGELGFVAGGRGSPRTPAVGSRLEIVRSSGVVGMMPAP